MKLTFFTITLALLVLIGVSGLSHGQAAGSPVSSNAATTGDETPAQVRAEESKDPRLKAMSASDQKAHLDEVAASIQYCTNNEVLNNFYSCSCFSKAVFDARMDPNAHMVKVAGGWQATPLVNLVPKLDISACVAPAKIPAYAANRTKAVVNVNPDVSPAQLVQLTDCVSSQLTTSFVAKPYPNIDAINGYFNSAYTPCYEKIVTGNAPASSQANPAPATTQNPGNAPAPRAPAPAARAPIPTTKSGLMGRLHSVINHATGAH